MTLPPLEQQTNFHAGSPSSDWRNTKPADGEKHEAAISGWKTIYRSVKVNTEERQAGENKGQESEEGSVAQLAQLYVCLFSPLAATSENNNDDISIRFAKKQTILKVLLANVATLTREPNQTQKEKFEISTVATLLTFCLIHRWLVRLQFLILTTRRRQRAVTSGPQPQRNESPPSIRLDRTRSPTVFFLTILRRRFPRHRTRKTHLTLLCNSW